MYEPEHLSRIIGIVLLAMAFSGFILFVRGYRPAGVSGLWYDLVLGFIALWLALWPELGNVVRHFDSVNGLRLLLQIIATAAGCILGALLAKAVRLLLLERRPPRSRQPIRRKTSKPRL